jgi:hypothetical protein
MTARRRRIQKIGCNEIVPSRAEDDRVGIKAQRVRIETQGYLTDRFAADAAIHKLPTLAQPLHRPSRDARVSDQDYSPAFGDKAAFSLENSRIGGDDSAAIFRSIQACRAAKPAMTATTTHPVPAAAINAVQDLIRATARLRTLEPKESRP